MTINLDSKSIEIRCPKCGKQLAQTIGRLKHNPHIPCPACGAIIHIKADELREALKSANKAASDLNRKIRDQFK